MHNSVCIFCLIEQYSLSINYHDESHEIRTDDYSDKDNLYLKEKRYTNIIKLMCLYLCINTLLIFMQQNSVVTPCCLVFVFITMAFKMLPQGLLRIVV